MELKNFNIDPRCYKRYMKSNKWYTKRNNVKKRANNICENCNNNLVQEIHHLSYENFGNEPLTDLQGLCSDCHKECHENP